MSNAVCGFRKCGINLFNPYIFSDNDFGAADMTNKPYPAPELPHLQQNTTSDGDLPDPQPNATSAGDLPDPQPNATSAGGLLNPQPNATSASSLAAPQVTTISDDHQ